MKIMKTAIMWLKLHCEWLEAIAPSYSAEEGDFQSERNAGPQRQGRRTEI
jgi:hypothetical protein